MGSEMCIRDSSNNSPHTPIPGEQKKDSQIINIRETSPSQVAPKSSDTTTTSLIEETYPSENSSDMSIDSERNNTSVVGGNTTNDMAEDSLMTRDIDSLHQSISSMREEFLER